MDIYLFNLINQFALKCFWLDVLAIFFAEYVQYALFFSLLLFLVVKFRKYLRMFIETVVAAIFARFVIVELIRWIWQRPRPFVHNNVNLLLTHDAPSFPSGHAALFFAVSTIVYIYNKKAGIVFFIFSFFICLSRVFAGIHWPLDILAGIVVGVFSGYLIHKASKKF